MHSVNPSVHQAADASSVASSGNGRGLASAKVTAAWSAVSLKLNRRPS